MQVFLQPVSRSVIRVGCTRRMVTSVPDEWLPRGVVIRHAAIQNPAYRPTDIFISLQNAQKTLYFLLIRFYSLIRLYL